MKKIPHGLLKKRPGNQLGMNEGYPFEAFFNLCCSYIGIKF